MLRSLAHRLTTTLTAAFLVVLSVVSAHEMVPSHDDLQRQAFAGVFGTSFDDFCGTPEHGQEHRCPLCHKLPDPPIIAAPDLERRIVHLVDQPVGRTLVLGPQHIQPGISPRAPPHYV